MKKRLVSLAMAMAMTTALAAGACAGEVTGDNISISLFAASIPENTPTGGALAAMADYINENSNGTIQAEAFYDTALGDATSMVQGLQMGTVDIGVSGTAYFSSLIPEVEVFQLPFLFSDLETARKATAGEAASMINEKFKEVQIVGLSFWENGFRELTNNVRPIKTPADMEGIKMRTLPADVQRKTWEAMGASATIIDASELYTALSQGTVQAQDNPLHEIVSRAFYEVQPYVTLTDAVYTPFYMAMSQMTWDRMSESQQQLILDAAEVGREKQFELTDAAQAEAKQTLLDQGCEIEENPDKEAFKEKAMPMWDIFTETSDFAKELVEVVQAGK